MNKYFLLFIIVFPFILFAYTNYVNNPYGSRIEIDFSNEYDLMDVRGDTLIKHIYINIPPEGKYNIDIKFIGEKYIETDFSGAIKNYTIEELFAGNQRILHLQLFPVKGNIRKTLIEKCIINITFEKPLIKMSKPNPLYAMSINSEYQMPEKRVLLNETIKLNKFIKIKIDSTGIYKITYNDIKKTGINPQFINPLKLALYTADLGYEQIKEPDIETYKKYKIVPIKFFGNNDNIFDENEYFLFLGKSINRAGRNYYDGFDLYNNPYTDNNVYALVLNSDSSFFALSPEYTFNSSDKEIFNSIVFHYDSINPLYAGYGWAWKELYINADSNDIEFEYDINIKSIATKQGSLKFVINYETKIKENYTLIILFNDSIIDTIEHSELGIVKNHYYSYFIENIENNNKFKLIMKKTDNNEKRLYFLKLQLDYYPNMNNIIENILIDKNIPDIVNIGFQKEKYIYYKKRNNAFLGIVNNEHNNKINTIQADTLYIGSVLRKPEQITYIDNSNISSFNGADIILITGNGMKHITNAYKLFRQQQGYKTAVFEIDEIYNAFTLGIDNPLAIKSFLYYGMNNWQKKPVYLLLLGSASFDYKNRLNTYENRNIVPVYEDGYSILKEPLLSANYSNISDRWYCKLIGDDELIDIIPGRITVINEQEARLALRKIIDYELFFDINSQNRVLVVPDDEYSSRSSENFNESIFMRNANQIDSVYRNDYFVKKLFIAEYMGDLQTYLDHWSTNPGYKRQIRYVLDSIFNWGVGFMIYIGHGANYTLAHEHILLYPEDLNVFTNKYKYPIGLFGTCNAGQYDYDEGALASEFQKLPYSGFAASIAAARATYNSPNNEIIRDIFSYDLLNKDFSTIGEYYQSVVCNNRFLATSFQLFGDPAMQLKNRIKDIDIEIIDTFIGGIIDTFILRFSENINDSVYINVYQPEYVDSHDYFHTEPYKYIYYNKSDGIIYKTTTFVNGDSLIVSFPLPESLASKDYDSSLIITAIYEKNKQLHYGMNRDNIYIQNSSNNVSIPEIKVKYNGQIINDTVYTPQQYTLTIEVKDDYGVYQGNDIRCKNSIIINNKDYSIVEFSYNENDNIYTGKIEYSSESQMDTIIISVFNNQLQNQTKTLYIKHINKFKTIDLVNVYPNPVKDSCFVSFMASKGGRVRIKILNQDMGEHYNKEFIYTQGFNVFKIDNLKLKPGIYIVELNISVFGSNVKIKQYKKIIKG